MDKLMHKINTNKLEYTQEAKHWVINACFGKWFGAVGADLILPTKEMKNLVNALLPFSTFTSDYFPMLFTPIDSDLEAYVDIIKKRKDVVSYEVSENLKRLLFNSSVLDLHGSFCHCPCLLR
jgi:hypothetical protein